LNAVNGKKRSDLKEDQMDGAEERLARAAGGDQAAFAELVREHQSMVFSLARRILKNTAIAEESAQEVFIDLYRSLGDIQSPAHLVFWLRKVTSHRCIDRFRSERRRLEESVEELPEVGVGTRDSDPLLSRTLRSLVASLPEMPRAIVTLRYQEELEPSEIAAILDLPVNTVKSHLRRSLAMLREKAVRTLGKVEV
jgi:RNA polymerase sigma-70 factor (ECF subfamily)